MKRTAEMIFTWIGILLFAAIIGLSIFVLNVKDNPELREEIQQGMEQGVPEGAEGSEANINVDQFIDMIGSGATFFLVVSIIAVVLGILSWVFLKGNKKPKAAGIILIITAVVGTIATAFLGFLAGAAYLIAGITALVRKSKTPPEGTV
ncbi:DUF4064 domain-containing protein [Thalassobacillus sp. CUG 92003]|uniref:DUF4064 domain-containing protein n=1 Tax=Thalassobacillus sp. CUG 92003 TaxID=2736641 RepID=UPI0015E691ED|nr:DUF4064 domain-containing protein [Thalassobacillus sp. CUG 92003]